MGKDFLKVSCLFALATACTERQSDPALKATEEKVATLEKAINALKPGLGEIMTTVHLHHAKLFFAGEKENWELANYQLDEIKEGLNQATELHDHIPETKASLRELRHVADTGISETESAIRDKSKERFNAGFKTLTESCNACHQAAAHEFIVVQIPAGPMFSNQRFSKEK